MGRIKIILILILIVNAFKLYILFINRERVSTFGFGEIAKNLSVFTKRRADTTFQAAFTNTEIA